MELKDNLKETIQVPLNKDQQTVYDFCVKAGYSNYETSVCLADTEKTLKVLKEWGVDI